MYALVFAVWTIVAPVGSSPAVRVGTHVVDLAFFGRWTLSFTPTIAVPKLLLAVRPSVAIDRSTVDVTDTRMRSEVYGTTIEWVPTWLQSLVSGQLSGTLTRSMTAAPLTARMQSRAANAAVTVHAKKARGMPMFAAPAPLPGTVAPPPPEPAPAAPAQPPPSQG